MSDAKRDEVWKEIETVMRQIERSDGVIVRPSVSLQWEQNSIHRRGACGGQIIL
jgi:hypothetical protein